jgi:hypothetical protein
MDWPLDPNHPVSIVAITDAIIGDISWLSLGDFSRDIHPS